MVAQTASLPNIKKLFIPKDGYIVADCDLDRADLQVVVWEADDQDLKCKLREGVDLHKENAKDAFGLRSVNDVTPLQRQQAKGFVHGCVVGDHEVLTPHGWVKIEDVPDTTPIMVCSIGGDSAHYETPESYWRGECNTTLIEFKGEAVHQLVTHDHRMPYATNSGPNWKVSKASELPKTSRLPKAIYFDGGINHPAPELLAAVHADGHFNISGALVFNFNKERKVSRLIRLLEIHKIKFEATKYEKTFRIYIPASELEGLELCKKLTVNCLQWSHDTALRYLIEQEFWDGHKDSSGAIWISSIDGSRADLCHTLAHLHKMGSQLNSIEREGRQRLYRWSLNNRLTWRLSSVSVTTQPANGRMVYCPKTSTGFWLTRYKGKISVTGNTNYGGRPATMAKTVGLTVHEADQAQKRWFAAHPGIKQWHERVQHELETTRMVRNKFGYRRFYFERIEGLLPEALAWVPQSTVAIVTNKGLVNLEKNVSDVELLLQTHDSITFQFPRTSFPRILPEIRKNLEIVVPYDDPLIIPVGISLSGKSWGDCKEFSWEGKPSED